MEIKEISHYTGLSQEFLYRHYFILDTREAFALYKKSKPFQQRKIKFKSFAQRRINYQSTKIHQSTFQRRVVMTIFDAFQIGVDGEIKDSIYSLAGLTEASALELTTNAVDHGRILGSNGEVLRIFSRT